LALVVALAVLAGACGCGKVKRAAQNVQAGRDLAQGKKATFTDESGKKVTVDVDKQGEGGKTTIEGDGGKVEVTQSGKEGEGTWKMTNKDGTTATATATTDVTEADIGLKFYPGATVKMGTKSSVTGPQASASATAMLTTDDAYDKVVKFYKDAYAKGSQVMESPDGTMILIGDGDNAKIVTVSKDKQSGQTQIMLTSGAKKG
jgi:hypothetical protein